MMKRAVMRYSPITLLQGDCLELMPKIPDKSVDMILTDLPYGVTRNEKDICLPLDKLWAQYLRIIRDNGCIALFAQGKFYIDLVSSNRKYFKYDLVWDKVLPGGFLNANRMPLRRHEQIAIFYKKQPTYNPQFTVGAPLHGKGTAYKNAAHERKNNNYGQHGITDDTRKGSTQKYPTSILTFPKPHSSIARHPTQKSVECCEWLIKTYTNAGGIVLDNCMGAGTTGIACKNTDRKFIGIELDANHFQEAHRSMQENP